MTRFLKLRPLCDGCEKAEAVVWCVRGRRTLCQRCNSGGNGVPIADASVLSALCSRCSSAPAARLIPDTSTSGSHHHHNSSMVAVCNLCARGISSSSSGTTLRDSPVAKAVVFDKMDFSNLSRSRNSSSSSSSSGSKQHNKHDRRNQHGGALRWVNTPAAPPATRIAKDIDLSYFKTVVPPSVARIPPRRPAGGSSGGRTSNERRNSRPNTPIPSSSAAAASSSRRK